jgi:hypothetical protein
MEIGEPHSFIGETVDLWSLEVGIAEATDSFVTHVIDHDDDEVGFICGLEKRRKKQGKGENAQNHVGKGTGAAGEIRENLCEPLQSGFVLSESASVET